MFAAIRFLAAMLALAIGWSAGVLALLGLTWVVWRFLSGVDVLAPHVPVPPPLIPTAILSLSVPVALVGACLVLYACLPARAVMYLFVARGATRRMARDEPAATELHELAERLGVGTPALYLYGSDRLNAWALSTLTGSVVAVSTGLVRSLSPAQRQWVLAHELAHVKHFDSGSAAFWAASERAVAFGWRLHNWIVNGTARVLEALRLPFVLWAVLCAPLFVVSYVLITADVVARGCFRALDRGVGRAMEYRSDRIATELVGSEPGVGVLSKLNGGIEPSFGIFATHPATHKRLRRVQKLQVTTSSGSAPTDRASPSSSAAPATAAPATAGRATAARPSPAVPANASARPSPPAASASRIRATQLPGSSRT